MNVGIIVISAVRSYQRHERKGISRPVRSSAQIRSSSDNYPQKIIIKFKHIFQHLNQLKEHSLPLIDSSLFCYEIIILLVGDIQGKDGIG